MRKRLQAKYLDFFFPVLSHYLCLLFLPHSCPPAFPPCSWSCSGHPYRNSASCLWTKTAPVPGLAASASSWYTVVSFSYFCFFYLKQQQWWRLYPPLSNVTDKSQRKLQRVSVDGIFCYFQVLSYNTKYKQNAWNFFFLYSSIILF